MLRAAHRVGHAAPPLGCLGAVGVARSRVLSRDVVQPDDGQRAADVLALLPPQRAVRAVGSVQVLEVVAHGVGAAPAVRLEMPRDANARGGRGVEDCRHQLVRAHALRVALDLQLGLPPPGEHHGVDASGGQLAHLDP